VADATCGFDWERHMPKVMMFRIGLWSLTVATGFSSALTGLESSTTSKDGSVPWEQRILAS
jgi:hypothetical protein